MDYMQVDDLTVILCNMLDNASEAMSEIDSASVEHQVDKSIRFYRDRAVWRR